MQTATDVKIVNGTYRNIEIKDAVFPLVKEYKEGKYLRSTRKKKRNLISDRREVHDIHGR